MLLRSVITAAFIAILTARPACAVPEADRLDGPAAATYTVRDTHFLHDVCSIIERESAYRVLPSAFIARLIRAESRFRAGAISPKGALGIAQFMPGTARIRRLDDPFDVSKAVPAAIRYLAELRERFGNLGSAAAAYNAGEARVEAWLAGEGRLPFETRAYVRRITGRAAEDWKGREDTAGDVAAIGDGRFIEDCVNFARGGAPAPAIDVAEDGDLQPWGVQIAQAASRAMALSLFRQIRERHARVIGDAEPMIVAVRNAAFGRARRLAAAVGAESREQAMKTCSAIRRAGGYCVVVRTGRS